MSASHLACWQLCLLAQDNQQGVHFCCMSIYLTERLS